MAWGAKSGLFKDSSQASQYGQFRPTYSDELYRTIYDFARPGSTDLAVDLGCGSGQAARELARKYAKVVAMDASEAQISQALKLPNIEYRCGPAEETGLPDHCADLLTVAQALHWMDLDRFYTEARRILKPGGTVAVWSYDLMRFDTPAANKVMDDLYNGVLGPYWDEGRRKVDAKYQGMEPLEGPFKDIKRLEMDMRAETNLANLVGHVSSWSGYVTYRQKNPDAPDPLVPFKKNIAQALGIQHDTDIIAKRFPLYLIMAKTTG
eukprot:jgi/Botrbrau1/19223/Bobra.0077s0123.1